MNNNSMHIGAKVHQATSVTRLKASFTVELFSLSAFLDSLSKRSMNFRRGMSYSGSKV